MVPSGYDTMSLRVIYLCEFKMETDVCPNGVFIALTRRWILHTVSAALLKTYALVYQDIPRQNHPELIVTMTARNYSYGTVNISRKYSFMESNYNTYWHILRHFA